MEMLTECLSLPAMLMATQVYSPESSLSLTPNKVSVRVSALINCLSSEEIYKTNRNSGSFDSGPYFLSFMFPDKGRLWRATS